MLTFLEWNFRLEALSYCRTNFLCKSLCELEKVHLKWKVYFKWKVHLKWKVDLKWKQFISTGKSPSQLEKVHFNWTFSQNRDFITKPILRDLFSIDKSLTNAYEK